MSYFVGQKVRINKNFTIDPTAVGCEGIILSNFNVSSIIIGYNVSVIDWPGMPDRCTEFQFKESELDLINQPKFKVGDKVRIISTDPLLKRYFHQEATVVQKNPTSFDIQTMDTAVGVTVQYTVDDTEIELIPQNQPVNQQTLSGRTGYAPIGGWNISLPPGIIFNDTVPIIEKSSHSCTWKTYTGLMYKEEYCECGATKNKRGIYE